MNVKYESGESDNSNPPEEFMETPKTVSFALLPDKSKTKYERKYQMFSAWCESKRVKKLTENVLIAYFAENSKVMKSSTLWSTYSMLKAMIQVKHDINISYYEKLLAFLKQQSIGYEPEKSKALSKDEVETFIKTAPDDIYLMKKVLLIIGIAGACKRDELTKMLVEYIEDIGSMLIVRIPESKTSKSRVFTITNNDGNDFNYLEIYRKYISLRPSGMSTGRLFLNYHNGVSSHKPVGVNTIAKVPADVAAFLNLPDPHMYTGDCFRRSSAILSRNGAWKSSTVAEEYIHDSISEETKECIDNSISEEQSATESTGHFILGQSPSPETPPTVYESNKFQEHSIVSSNSSIIIRNCENCTFNITITNKK